MRIIKKEKVHLKGIEPPHPDPDSGALSTELQVCNKIIIHYFFGDIKIKIRKIPVSPLDRFVWGKQVDWVAF